MNTRIPSACVEDVKVSAQRGLDKSMVRQLGSCAWIGEHLNVLITGLTGVGKSYLACALGQVARRKGMRVGYGRVPRLFDEPALARTDGSYARVLSRLAKLDVLILDNLGLGTPKEAQRHDLLEVLEDRYGRVSTVITSQLEVKKWHEWIGDPTVADAILDPCRPQCLQALAERTDRARDGGQDPAALTTATTYVASLRSRDAVSVITRRRNGRSRHA